MWAQQSRFDGAFERFATIAAATGYSGIEVSHSTDQAGLETLLREGVAVPVRGLHAPTPKMNGRRGQTNAALNLASVDDEERAEAVEHTRRTIDYAGRAGLRYIVVHLGGLPRMLAGEGTLRRLYQSGRIDSDEARAAQAEAHQQRREAITPHLAAARRSLSDLVEAGAAVGVAIGLENRLHFHEIPSATETAELLTPYPNEVAGYWHDVGHAEVQMRLGLIDARAAVRLLTPRLIGTHLHDVRGILDHRAPGNGDVEWSYIAAALRPETHRTLEIDQREPESLLSTALTFLAERGILATP